MKAACQAIRDGMELEYQNFHIKLQTNVDDKALGEYSRMTKEYVTRITELCSKAHPVGKLAPVWDALMSLAEHAVHKEQEVLQGYKEENDEYHRETDALMLEVCKDEGVTKPEHLEDWLVNFLKFIYKYTGIETDIEARYKETLIYPCDFGEWTV